MKWYCALDGSRFALSQQDCLVQLYLMQQILEVQNLVDEKLGEKMDQQIQGYMSMYESKDGSYGQ